MEPSYEFFDHTADVGIRVRAPTLPELVIPAGEALYAVIGEIAGRGDGTPVTFDLTGEEPAELLRDYLGELLILFERDARTAGAVDVSKFTDSRLTVTVQVRPIDRGRSVFHHEVKAVTYHELDVKAIPGGYEATVIVDI
jgi:SHS2 domain-containing protein